MADTMSNLLAADDRFFEDILVYVPGATLEHVKSVAASVVREFFTDSGCWVEELPAIDVVAGKADYYFSPQPRSLVLYVVAAMFDAGSGFSYLRPMSEAAYITLDATATGTPAAFRGHLGPIGQITVYPAPESSATGALKIIGAQTVREPWDYFLPTSLYVHHKEILSDGVKGRMMAIPDKPYTNIALSQYHLRRFRSGIARAREMARRQYIVRDDRITFPRWA